MRGLNHLRCAVESSRSFYKFGFEHHLADALNLAVNVVIAIDKSIDFHFGTDFGDRRSSLHFQIFYECHVIAVVELIPI